MRLRGAVTAVAISGAVLAGCGGGEISDEKPEASVAAEAESPAFEVNVGAVAKDVVGIADEAMGKEAGDRCVGLKDGLGVGMAVSVRDEQDQIVGGGSIAGYRFLTDPARCLYIAEAVEVEADRDFYYVQIGDWTSEPVREQEARDGGLSLTID